MKKIRKINTMCPPLPQPFCPLWMTSKWNKFNSLKPQTKTQSRWIDQCTFQLSDTLLVGPPAEPPVCSMPTNSIRKCNTTSWWITETLFYDNLRLRKKEALAPVRELHTSVYAKSKFWKIIAKPLARAPPCTETIRISACELPRVLFRLCSDAVPGISNLIVTWV